MTCLRAAIVSGLLVYLTAVAPRVHAQTPYLVKDISPGSDSFPTELTRVEGLTFFAALDLVHGYELWRSDGTTAGTMLLDIGPGPGSPTELVNVDGMLFFVGIDDLHGAELWKSDGTVAGTTLIRDIVPGLSSPIPVGLAATGRTVFFRANDGVHGAELWKSDGTAQGTVLVKDIRTGPSSSSPEELTNVGGTLFFSAYDDEHGTALWKSDGTAEGTTLVADTQPGSGTLPLGELTDVNGMLFFAAADGVDGAELWKSDGQPGGTVAVKSMSSFPEYLTNINGTLYFRASDGVHGSELWKSDGTSPGTGMIKDILPGPMGSSPGPFTNVDGAIYFPAADDVSGNELWKTDGAETGTLLVKDIYPGSTSSDPHSLARVGNTLFFVALDPTAGFELWRSDGSAASTFRIADIRPGASTSFPDELTTAPPGLLFRANNGSTGSELWALAPPTISKNDGRAIVAPGETVTHRIEVTNPGEPPMAATVTDTIPVGIENVTWTCAAVGGAVCTPSGAGHISDSVTLPARSGVTFLATGTIAASAIGTITNIASVVLGPSSYTATDVDVVAAPMSYFVIDPCRIVDTRQPGGLLGAPSMQAQETRVFPAHGHCGIPVTARALALNVTVTGSGATGNVRLFPTGQAPPTISNVNYSAGQTRGANAVVSLSASGEFSAYVGQPLGTTVDVVIDVAGYFE